MEGSPRLIGVAMLHSDAQDRLRLIDRPHLNTEPHMPQHRDIAQFMLLNATGLSDIAASTGASISVVIDVCDAREAVGLVRGIPPGSPGPAGDFVDRSRSSRLGRVPD